MKYRDFRTGYTYRDIWQMLWVDNPDPSTWVRKSRGRVLSEFRALKTDLWASVTGGLRPDEECPDPPPEEGPPPAPPGRGHLIPIRKEIVHRGRTFAVTYWTKPKTKAA